MLRLRYLEPEDTGYLRAHPFCVLAVVVLLSSTHAS
jgi:hypothetical protein